MPSNYERETLAEAIHLARIECNFWWVDGARTEREFHLDHAKRIIEQLERMKNAE